MSTYNHPDLPDALMNQPLPRIISRGETFRAAIGERVILPCQVKDLGEYRIRITITYYDVKSKIHII